jgi:hypothetical protein
LLVDLLVETHAIPVLLVIDDQRLIENRDPHSPARDALLVQRPNAQHGILPKIHNSFVVKAFRHARRLGPVRAVVEVGMEQVCKPVLQVRAGHVIASQVHLRWIRRIRVKAG